MTVQSKEITVAHSPDSDDVFMFYALAHKKLNTNGLIIKQIAKDIQSLNEDALQGKYEVTAISFAAYPQICDRYYLTTCGASMGDGYGPVLIAQKPLTQDELRSARIAIPGKLTTAFLCLKLYQPKLENIVEVPFDQVIELVSNGSVDAGLLIHEGQLLYKGSGVQKILDLGQWWFEKTNLPLPLGGNAIRKDLGDTLIDRTTKLLKASIVYGLEHRQAALDYAIAFAFSKDMERDLVDKYIDMYVNDLTIDCGERGRQAVTKLFDEAFERGVLPQRIVPEFVG